MNQPSRLHILKVLKNIGLCLSTLSVPVAANERKEEILTNLRHYYQTLRKATDVDGAMDSSKLNNYLVAIYLKDKRNGLLSDIDNKLEWLKKIKLISNYYKVHENLRSIQNELIEQMKV